MNHVRKNWVPRGGVLLAAGILLGAGACARKEGVEGGFEYASKGMSAELTGVVQDGGGADGAPETGQEGIHVKVPSKLGGKTVRSVAAGAFRSTAAVSVRIPRRVSEIGPGAFAGNTNLVWVELPSRLKRVEEELFLGCGRMEESDIPDRVEEIGARAYAGCGRLKRVRFPARLRSLGECAFSGCAALDPVELPEGIADIPEGAFENCTGLKYVRIPAGVTNVGARAFAGCTSLERVELPEGLRGIGAGAFARSGLSEVSVPGSVERLGERAFAECGKLESVKLAEGVADVADGAFEGCTGLKSAGIPGGVTNVGARAFAGCASLERVELPEGLRGIGAGAFTRSGLLGSFTLPGSLERLGGRAFEGCGGLRSLEVAEGNPVFSVRDGVLFRDGGTELALFPCGRGGTYAVPEGVRSVGDDAFAQCGLLESVVLPASVERLGERAFEGCVGLRSVEVAEGNPVFSDRDGVLFRDGGEELVLFPRARGGAYAVPEGVRRIGPCAFRGSRVEKVETPGGVETLAEGVFRDCRRLRRVTLAEGVRELGAAAFAGCTALWEFTVPDSVERAGEGLFDGCEGLMALVVPDRPAGETPPKEAWWAPDGCAIVSQSALEEARKGKRSPEGTAPFYGLYAGEDLDPVSFEGTVLATSALPDPSKNDYDDCLQAILVELDSVLSETPSSADVERVVLVNVPAMEGRVLVGKNAFEPGDKVACTCAAYESMPESILEIQLSDDIRSFEHQQYYPLRIEKIPAFRETGNKYFAKREISVFPVRTLPRDEKAAAARRERIQKEIARVESELARHGGTFEAWKEEYKPIAEKYARLCEEGRAVWIGDSHFAAGCRETTYKTRAYIEGLLPYKKYLEENNIDLIVVRVPSRGDFAARVLASDDFRENPAWMEHYLECLKNDIEIVDPMPEMWKERFDFPLFYFYQDPDQRHPFEGTAMVMAKEIANVLQRYPYERNAPGIVLRDVLFKTRDPLYFWPAGNEKRDPSENVVFKQALRDGEPCKEFAFRSGSPFLLLSNSYFWFPEWTLGASVPAYTAHFIEAIPDWRYRGGIDNQMITFLLEPHLLDGRRAVVMSGGFDAWKGFPTIPKYIPDGARRITLEKTVAASSGEMAIRDPAGSFERSAAGDGSVRFEFNGNYPERGDSFFDLDVSVPGIEGKRTAMIRVNFEQTSTLVVDLVDGGSGAVLDTVRVLPGRVAFADFFLPLAEGSSDVTIRVYPRNPETGLVVSNIELWYY